MGEFKLNKDEKRSLLQLARESIYEHYNIDGNSEAIAISSQNLQVACGNFVSVYLNNELRGCIGYMTSKDPLCDSIGQTAVAAVSRDHRFSPLKKSEVPKLKLEISVLTPMKEIQDMQQIELGKHGIYIRKDFQTGTFLPQVAEKTRWTREEFLGHCSRDKAGIGWDGWKNAELFTYEAIVFGDET